MKSGTNNCKDSKKTHQCFNALVLFLLVVMLGSAAASEVKVEKLPNGHYQLLVDGNPYIVKGACYNPIPVGQGPLYDWWQDPNKPWLTDGKLMQEMGLNTVRFYETSDNSASVKEVIGDLYQTYGVRSIIGHWVGFWEYPCPFYADKNFREKIKKDVLAMVANYKDEPGVLMWVLGNENNYSFCGRLNPWPAEEIDKENDPQKRNLMRAKVYYSFINELAKEIHKVDPQHPVALGNGELVGLEYASSICPDIDLVAGIIYRGKTFGNLFNSLKMTFDKPLLLAEFGADAHDAGKFSENQDMQANFLEMQWRQIYENLANNPEGTGNCLGGVMFEWTDEWWKHSEYDEPSWSIHNQESSWSNGSYYFDIQAVNNKNMNEEWFGIVALSEELENGVNKRLPRKAYYSVQEFWRNPDLSKKPANDKS